MSVQQVLKQASRTSIVVIGLVAGVGLGSAAQAAPAAQATATAPATTAGPSCVAPPQGIVVVIDVPNPGAELSAGGNVVVAGVAYDTASTSGSGIDRVSVFLGDRDAGGTFWGDATLNLPSPAQGAMFTNAGFSRRSPTIPNESGSRSIYVYAHSLVSGREVSTSVPVFLGSAPTQVPGRAPTPVPAPPVFCTPVPTSTATSVPPTATLTPVEAPATSTPFPTLVVGVPTPRPPTVVTAASPTPLPADDDAPAAAPPAMPVGQAVAPRGGGIPPELGLLVLGLGAGVVGGGFALRRRERRGAPPRA